jgi:hypothetical protein
MDEMSTYLVGDGIKTRDDTLAAKSAPREQQHARDGDFLLGGHWPTSEKRLILRDVSGGKGVCGGAHGVLKLEPVHVGKF